MDWTADGPTWPLSEHSEFVVSPPHRWHVQCLGAGPVAVLIHGAGGATQSFRHLAPLLATRFRVVMMDLPGQGFTTLGSRQRSGLRETRDDLSTLFRTMNVSPDLLVGHSAGAAIALSLAKGSTGLPVVGINPALDRFEGPAGWLFPVLAKVLSLNPFIPGLFARLSRTPGRVEGLLASTGSTLDPAGTALYRRLIGDRSHVDGTLLMMAHWKIDDLVRELPEIETPALFLTGSKDGAVPPSVAHRAAEILPNAKVSDHLGVGHLMHETDPASVAEAVTAFADGLGLFQPSSD